MYDLDTVMPRIQPQCFSTTSLKHKLVPSLNQGWEEWAWKDKVSDDILITPGDCRCPRNPWEISDGERPKAGAWMRLDAGEWDTCTWLGMPCAAERTLGHAQILVTEFHTW